jgi:SAM-dependent methyltransferase
MQIKLSREPSTGTTTRGKESSKWRIQMKRALVDPVGFSYRALKGLRWKLYVVLLNLFCDILFRWGNRIGVPGNFRARMYWKAGRREIVPLPQLYDFLSQERPMGQYYPAAPKWSARSQTIINMLCPLITKEFSILEIGCNIGRNLNHLWQAGYKNVRGIEISEHAVKRLRIEYPCLAMVPVDIGPAELLIQKYDSNSVDVIFTMSVLEELHPDSRFLFNEIARVARKYVLAIEPRHGKRSHMQYPWDIKSEFTAVGLTHNDSKPWSVLWAGELTQENEWVEDMHTYDAFLFKVNQGEADDLSLKRKTA